MERVSNLKVSSENVGYTLGIKRCFYKKIREKLVLEKGSKNRTKANIILGIFTCETT